MPTALRRLSRTLLVVAALGLAGAAHAASPSPLATAATPAPTVSGTAPSATRTAPKPTVTATTQPRPSATAARRVAADDAPAAEAEAPEAPVATAVLRTRAYRTPERAAPPAFVPPDAAARDAETSGAPGDVAPAPGAPAARPGGTGLVVLRMTARTAIEGFDLRVSYPPSLGNFASGAQGADCNAGTGVFVAANDGGNGELKLVVAGARPLPFPLDVFCRFSTAPGGGLDAGAFEVRVAEVTSDAKRAEVSLLIVSVAVR